MEDSKNKSNGINNVNKGAVHSGKKQHKKEKASFHYKNLLMILFALILFGYAGLITIVPAVITRAFNIPEFANKFYDTTGFETSLDNFNYSISPNLHALIELNNFGLQWLGKQQMFEAKRIEIETKNPFAVITKNFDIESVKVSNAHYSDQMINDPKTNNLINKLNLVAEGFNPEKFGAKKVVIKPGYVTVKNYKISYITPSTYDEKIIAENTYTKADVRNFLMEHPISNVQIK